MAKATETTMEELFLEELRDLYDAEKQITKALPKMVKAASSEDLKAAFEEHLEQTQNQVQRLEQIFETLGEKATGKKCAAMAGLLHEGDELISEHVRSAVRDAGLIAAAQKVEHYEISGYGSARTHAQLVGNDAAAQLLEETLNEEKETDEKLNELATSAINEDAMMSGSHDDDTEEAAPVTSKPVAKTTGASKSAKPAKAPQTSAARGSQKH